MDYKFTCATSDFWGSYLNRQRCSFQYAAHRYAVLVHMFPVLLLAKPTLTRFALSVLVSQVTTILLAPSLRSAPACFHVHVLPLPYNP